MRKSTKAGVGTVPSARLPPKGRNRANEVTNARKSRGSSADRVARHVAKHASVEHWCEENLRRKTLPPTQDPARRESCRLDLPKFLRTYLPGIYTRPFSDAGLRFLGDVQELMLGGGLKCMAQPRGTGKTALISGAMLWAAVYGHRRYLAAIAAKDEAADDLVKDILANIQAPLILADFPEYAIPFIALEGRAQRCASQTYRGKATRIQQKTDRLMLPSLLGGSGDGVVIQAAGLTGAVRGMHQVAPDGSWVRPDFVLLDDPQTRESAKSASQTDEREKIILGDVMGLAGHDRNISAVMACTVIAPGDLADRFLDAKKRPEWRGQREKLVTKWGGSERLWDEYDQLWRDEEAGRQPRGSCSAWWERHRASIERGSKVLDDALYGSNEVSALQHARNLYLKHGEDAFSAEYQNTPPSLTPDAEYHLDSEDVLKKVNGRPRGVVPDDCPTVTAGIDINRYAIAWCVVASNLAGDVAVVDYGWWTPRGRRQVWEDGENRETKISAGVEAVTDGILAHPKYGELVETVVVDAGYAASTVYDSVTALQLRYRHRRIVAGRGLPGDRYQLPRNPKAVFSIGVEADVRKQFPAGKVFYFDSHHWHISTQKGWMLPAGVAGGTTVFGRAATQHAQFASQVTADELVATTIGDNGRQVAVWNVSRHNEMGDCLAEAAAAASLGRPAMRRKEERKAAKMAREAVQAADGEDVEGTEAAKVPESSAKRVWPHARRRGNWVTGGLF